MGNHASKPIERKNNTNDAVGTNLVMSEMCVSGGNTSSATKYMPQNGEYAMNGTGGSCNYCINCEPNSMEKGSGCDNGLCGFSGGSIPQYKRIGYNADKTGCCTNNGQSTIGNLTCDPRYRGGSTSNDCNDVYAAKCTGAAVATDACKTWCDRNPNDCISRNRDYCKTGNNMNLQYCRDKAKKIGGMDEAVTDWCSTHKDDPFCSCYKATFEKSTEALDPESKAILSRPECYISKCSSGTAYQYDDMKSNKSCPPVNLCKNTISIVGNTDVNLANVTQSCVQSIVTAPVIATAPTDPVVNPNEKITTSTTNTKTPVQIFIDKYLYYILAIVFILVLGIGALALFSGDDTDIDTSDDQHILDVLSRFNMRKKSHVMQMEKEKYASLPSSDSMTTLNEL